MTIFKSRQINTDPEPWVCYETISYDGLLWDREPVRRHNESHEGDVHLDPRPEFNATRDPEPWVDEGSRSWDFPNDAPEREATAEDCAQPRWAPRPEFDNPVNPILADMRKDIEAHGDAQSAVRDTLEWVTHYAAGGEVEGMDGVMLTLTFDHIAHARKVLTRLANWSAS